jgi:cytochrome c-type biogenesis protein CcmH
MIASAASVLFVASGLTFGAISFSQQPTSWETPGRAPAQEVADPHEGPFGAKLLYLEHSLRCSCGCNLDLHTCQLQMQCGTSPAWSRRILEELERGESEEVILAGFVADFGKSVLMAPPLEGFNWIAYLLPSTAIVIAAMGIGLVVRRGVRTPRPSGVSPTVSSEEWTRLEAEMRGIEEEE